MSKMHTHVSGLYSQNKTSVYDIELYIARRKCKLLKHFQGHIRDSGAGGGGVEGLKAPPPTIS